MIVRSAATTLSFVLAALAVAWVGMRPASAVEEASFHSAVRPHTAFQLKRAKSKGIELEAKIGTPLHGLLFRPAGNGPFPAVVLVHGCRGVRMFHADWSERLVDWGYVVLLVDSFKTRGFQDICVDHHDLALTEVVTGRSADAFGAQDFLSRLPFVDSEQIALMGWGKFGVLNTVTNSGISQIFDYRFQAAVTIYPDCEPFVTSTFNTPLLVLIGDTNSASWFDRCEMMGAASATQETPTNIKIYHGAEPGFDDPEVVQGVFQKDDWNWAHMPKRGVLYKYDRDAHEDAIRRVERFLKKHLGRQQ